MASRPPGTRAPVGNRWCPQNRPSCPIRIHGPPPRATIDARSTRPKDQAFPSRTTLPPEHPRPNRSNESGSNPGAHSTTSRCRIRLPLWSSTKRPSTRTPAGNADTSPDCRSPLTETPPPAIVRRASPREPQRPLATRASTRDSWPPRAGNLTIVSGTMPRRASRTSTVGEVVPNRPRAARSARTVSSPPWTNVHTSSANRRWAARLSGATACPAITSATSATVSYTHLTLPSICSV